MSRRPASTQTDELLQKKKTFHVEEDDDESENVDVENWTEESGEDDDGHTDNSSENVKKKYEPRTFLVHPYQPHDELAVEYFNGHKVTKEAKSLMESGKNGFHAMSSTGKGKFPVGKSLTWLEDKVKGMLRGKVTRDDVGLVIIFGTVSFDQMLGKQYNKLELWQQAKLFECMEIVEDLKTPRSNFS